jgi:hypothetical protein
MGVGGQKEPGANEAAGAYVANQTKLVGGIQGPRRRRLMSVDQAPFNPLPDGGGITLDRREGTSQKHSCQPRSSSTSG